MKSASKKQKQYAFAILNYPDKKPPEKDISFIISDNRIPVKGYVDQKTWCMYNLIEDKVYVFTKFIRYLISYSVDQRLCVGLGVPETPPR